MSPLCPAPSFQTCKILSSLDGSFLSVFFTKGFIDLFDGVFDLERQLIRAVGLPQERFSEDALRMMRCLRFASQLDFEIESETLEAISDHHQLLENISIERIQIEYVKLMQGVNRPRGLAPFIASGAYNYCPGFPLKKAQLINLMNLSTTPIKEEALVWLLTLTLLEIPTNDYRRFLSQWKTSNQLIKQVSSLARGLTYRLENQWTNQWLYELGERDLILVEDALAYFGVPSQLHETVAAYNALPIHSVQDLAISGKEILALTQAKPGPWVGSIIAEIEAAVLVGTLENQGKTLSDYATSKIKEMGELN